MSTTILNVLAIDDYAFNNMFILNDTGIETIASTPCNSLTSIVIPNSVTYIGNSAFSGCSGLSSVNIGNSVTYIGNSAFEYCNALTSITIPNSVTSIGYGAFKGCSSLTSLTLGESVVYIGEEAFASSLLQNITCLSPNPPTLFNNSFPYPNIATVIVPCGSLEAYTASTSYWSLLFADRIEEDCDASLEEIEELELSFYPNPTNGKITFSSKIERIEVIDLSGKLLFTFANAREINIDALPSGAYYLRLTNNDKAIMRKVIKE